MTDSDFMGLYIKSGHCMGLDGSYAYAWQTKLSENMYDGKRICLIYICLQFQSQQ